jgi:hypothetical protein
MADALYQNSTTSLSGEEPFIGDGLDGEIATNTADARSWVFDPTGVPLELGGAVKNRPVSNLFVSNYADIDVTNTINLPIANPNPSLIPAGYYSEVRILMRFSQSPLSIPYAEYFDFPVNWGLKSLWDPRDESGSSSNPIDFYKSAGRSILVELSSFGPNQSWTGRVLWVSSL